MCGLTLFLVRVSQTPMHPRNSDLRRMETQGVALPIQDNGRDVENTKLS